LRRILVLVPGLDGEGGEELRIVERFRRHPYIFSAEAAAGVYSGRPDSGRIAAMPELTEEQRMVLDALMVQTASPAERTLDALRSRTRLDQVSPILRQLENDFDPPLVEHEIDEGLETRFWRATLAAAEVLDAQS
jgi:hypothetical protein